MKANRELPKRSLSRSSNRELPKRSLSRSPTICETHCAEFAKANSKLRPRAQLFKTEDGLAELAKGHVSTFEALIRDDSLVAPARTVTVGSACGAGGTEFFVLRAAKKPCKQALLRLASGSSSMLRVRCAVSNGAWLSTPVLPR